MLEEKAMLIKCTFSQWTARKQDKNATKETQQHFEAKENTGSYIKYLIDKEEMKKLKSIETKKNSIINFYTLPWDANGWNIVTAKAFLELTNKLQEVQSEGETAVNDFLSTYAEKKEKARKDLGKLFDEKEYPSVEQLKRKFAFTVDYMPLPNVADFRIDIGNEQLDKIKKETEERLSETFKEAMKEPYKRLYEVLEKIVERLSDKSNKFHDSLFGNVAELLEVIPALNLTDDPTLNRLTKIIENNICSFDPADVRKDEETRKECCKEAKEIIDLMADYM